MNMRSWCCIHTGGVRCIQERAIHGLMNMQSAGVVQTRPAPDMQVAVFFCFYCLIALVRHMELEEARCTKSKRYKFLFSQLYTYKCPLCCHFNPSTHKPQLSISPSWSCWYFHDLKQILPHVTTKAEPLIGYSDSVWKFSTGSTCT